MVLQKPWYCHGPKNMTLCYMSQNMVLQLYMTFKHGNTMVHVIKHGITMVYVQKHGIVLVHDVLKLDNAMV